MTTKLKISDTLSLPLDVVTQKLAWLGRTGSGKTYGATKLAELMLERDAQVIALDPVGVWCGLRLGPDSFTLPVFGGLHGDIPLESTGGGVVADLLVDRRMSAVLDVSQMIDADQRRFVVGFATRFFQRMKAAPSAVHVFLEEAQEFVPQDPKGAELMLNAFHRIVKIGRNFGIGVSLITQRPQEVNKKALNQTECLFAFQMTGPQERKAIAAWVETKGMDQTIVDTLPKLKVGTAHVWSPQWLNVSGEVQIATKRSADISTTPKVGANGAGRSKPLSKIDLTEIGEAMAATIERAKQDDPKELRKRIAELARELTQAKFVAPAPVLDWAWMATQRNHLDVIDKQVRLVRAGLHIAEGQLTKAGAYGKPPQPNKLPPKREPEGRPLTKLVIAAAHAAEIGKGKLGVGERTVLIACAQLGPVSRTQLTIVTGYKRSTRDKYLQHLQADQLIADSGSGFTATTAGIAELGTDYEPLPKGDALREHWLSTLPAGEREVLQAVAAQYPGVVSRGALTETTGYKRSTRDKYVQRLAARKLIIAEREGVRASGTLFS